MYFFIALFVILVAGFVTATYVVCRLNQAACDHIFSEEHGVHDVLEMFAAIIALVFVVSAIAVATNIDSAYGSVTLGTIVAMMYIMRYVLPSMGTEQET